MQSPPALGALIYFTALLAVVAANFTSIFGPDTPTQCDDYPVSWTGGTPPFKLTLAHVKGTQQYFSIPDSNFNNGRGSFAASVPYHESENIIAIMSDASGFASGGISDVLTVGAPIGGDNCTGVDLGSAYNYDISSETDGQCGTWTFSGYEYAVQPITIFGVIPGGESFILRPPAGPISFDWTADLTAGTSVMFFVNDSQGREGGSSEVYTIAASSDATCLNANSPVSVSNAPSSSTISVSLMFSSTIPDTHSSSSSATSIPSNDGSAKKTNMGVIVGAVLATVVGLCIIAALAFCFIRRRRDSGLYYDGATSSGSPITGHVNAAGLTNSPQSMGDMQAGQMLVMSIDHGLYFSQGTATQYSSPSSHDLSSRAKEGEYDPYAQSTPLSTPDSAPHSVPSEYSSFASSQPGTSASRPIRYIVHTDLVEGVPAANEQVIELPPQYSARRAPIPGISEFSRPGSATSLLPLPLVHQQGDPESNDVGSQQPVVSSFITLTSPPPSVAKKDVDG